MNNESGNSVDQDLLLNRVLDKYGEVMRISMRPEILKRFDALTPDARRVLVTKQINKAGDNDGNARQTNDGRDSISGPTATKQHG